MTYPAFIDAEVSEGNPGNLIEFPETFPGNPGNVSRKPLGNPSEVSEVSDYSSTDLASAVGVSRQAWARDWFPHLAAVTGESPLRTGRRYTVLCRELNLSLLAARRSGQSASAWVVSASAQRPGQTVEARAAVVAMASDLAIVPAAVGQALSIQTQAIGQAQGLADLAGALLDRTVQLISADRQQLLEGDASIADALIIAKETSRILHEEQLKARVRAQFEAKRLAAQTQELSSDLAQLQGGQHG